MADRAEVLLRGGAVWTGTGDATDAVAVGGGRVVATGDAAHGLRGSATEVVDLDGGMLLPGFRDGHLHPLTGGVKMLTCALFGRTDLEDALDHVRRHAAAAPGDGWVRGYGLERELLPQGIGRAELLDRVVADRPVMVVTADAHMVWCNSRALEVAGITASTADPPGGTIVRDADGRPVGTLLEDADRLLEPHLPPPGRDEQVRGLEVALGRMTAAGVVWGQEARSRPEWLEHYQRVADAGGLTCDLDVAFELEPDAWREQLPTCVEARAQARASARRRARDGVRGGRLTATTVKLFVDGVVEGGTALLLDPYLPLPGQPTGGADTGIGIWEPDELAAAACAADVAGFQLHLHAIGDAAVRLALDTVATVAARNGPAARRPVVAHAQLVHPADRPRFRQLGVVANLQPLWAQRNAVMTELTEPRLGPERSTWQYPIGTLLREGAHLSFGSDWPVSSLVPLEGIAVAVTRETADGRPPGGWHPAERIRLDQALAAYTTGTAYQAGDEAVAGTIAVGQRADLVAVDADLRGVAARELPDVRVRGTWLAGRRVEAD